MYGPIIRGSSFREDYLLAESVIPKTAVLRKTGLILLFLCCACATGIPSFALQASDPERLPTQVVSSIIEQSIADQYARLWNGMSSQARAGYRHLVNNRYLPADFDEEVLSRLDHERHVWPLADSPLASKSRQDTWKAYGLSPRPDDPSKPLQYVVDEQGRYSMNCFACHGGNLYGATYPGAPNTTYALASLTEQVRKIKIASRKTLTHMDIGSVFMPLGTTVGTSNAVMFGVALMNYRDAELNVFENRAPAEMVHHDMDAPAWWHFHRKRHIYIDGFAEKGHRGLMQFMLVKQNGPKQFQEWENEFRDVYTFLQELRPPKYPLNIVAQKAQRGSVVFQKACAHCHGTYSPNVPEYSEVRVPIEEIKTDRVRLDSLSQTHRRSYGQSWFAHFGMQQTFEQVDGYVAPPLDGIWATAPYLHNGSVPTLWHMLHPNARPKVWKRNALALDIEKVGLCVEEFDSVPDSLGRFEHRWFFDTGVTGKSSAGHDYPNELSEEEKDWLLEYLKTL